MSHERLDHRLGEMSVLDFRTVSKLRRMEGKDGGTLFDDMTPVFTCCVASHIDRLDTLVANAEGAEAEHVACELAGASASFGAQRLKAVSHALRRACAVGSWDHARTLLARLHDEYDRLKTHLGVMTTV